MGTPNINSLSMSNYQLLICLYLAIYILFGDSKNPRRVRKSKTTIKRLSPFKSLIKVLDSQDSEDDLDDNYEEQENTIPIDLPIYDELDYPLEQNASAFKDLVGFNLVGKTKSLSKSFKEGLEILANNENTVKFIDELIETNPCISSLEGIQGLLEQGATVIEKSGTELEEMFVNFVSLSHERNISRLVHGSAKLLLQLESVFPKLESIRLLTRCRTSPELGINSMRDLAQILYRMSFVKEFPQSVKDKMMRSALITETTTSFLEHMQENFADMDCFTETDFLGDGMLLAGRTLNDMAEVLGVMGYFPEAKRARQFAAFTRATAATMEKLEGFKISDDCSPGVLGRVASYLQDLATVLDEVGLETLAVHVGIVFRHDLLP